VHGNENCFAGKAEARKKKEKLNFLGKKLFLILFYKLLFSQTIAMVFALLLSLVSTALGAVKTLFKQGEIVQNEQPNTHAEPVQDAIDWQSIYDEKKKELCSRFNTRDIIIHKSDDYGEVCCNMWVAALKIEPNPFGTTTDERMYSLIDAEVLRLKKIGASDLTVYQGLCEYLLTLALKVDKQNGISR